jgi:hypothetical protein
MICFFVFRSSCLLSSPYIILGFSLSICILNVNDSEFPVAECSEREGLGIIPNRTILFNMSKVR